MKELSAVSRLSCHNDKHRCHAVGHPDRYRVTRHSYMQANKGAKNHAVIMPDANPEATAAALVGASMGAAGQRCMAISAAVFVGGMGKYKDAIVKKAQQLKVTAGHEPGCDVGPVISQESKKRVESLIDSGIQQVSASAMCTY